jgi:hypothetical protein
MNLELLATVVFGIPAVIISWAFAVAIVKAVWDELR